MGKERRLEAGRSGGRVRLGKVEFASGLEGAARGEGGGVGGVGGKGGGGRDIGFNKQFYQF